MSHYDAFVRYMSGTTPISHEDLLNGPAEVTDLDKMMFGYGDYVVDCARQFCAGMRVIPRVQIDHEEHKNNVLHWIGTFTLGGREYEMLLERQGFYQGKLVDSLAEFHNTAIADVRSVLKNYLHVNHHIIRKLDQKFYNPAQKIRPEPLNLDEYL